MFLRVQLPQLRVALLGGSLLVALHLLAEFGALQMLRYPTFTTAIYDQYRATFNGPGATMLAGVLVLLCLVLLLAEIRLRGRRGYARTGRGAARPPRPVALRRAHRARAGSASAALVGLALVVPLASLGYWMVARRLDRLRLGTPWPPPPGRRSALAAAAAAVTTAMALPTGWLAVRARGRVSTLLERSTYLGSSVPGHRRRPGAGDPEHPGHARGSTRRCRCCWPPTRSCSCRGRSSPCARRSSSRRRLYDDVAASLGSTAPDRLRRVTLPLLAPGIGAGAALVFLAVVTELTATLLLAPTGNDDAGHGVLVGEQRPGVRRGRPVRRDHGAALGAPATVLLSRDARRGLTT